MGIRGCGRVNTGTLLHQGIPPPSRMRGSSASTTKSFDPSVSSRPSSLYSKAQPTTHIILSTSSPKAIRTPAPPPNSPTHPSQILFAPDIRPCLPNENLSKKRRILTYSTKPTATPSFLPYNYYTDIPASLSRPDHGQAYLVARAGWLRT